MTRDQADEHEHELDAEYLAAADATIVDIYEDESLRIDAVLPCPTCSEPVRASARVDAVVDADVDLPIDDSEDVYD